MKTRIAGVHFTDARPAVGETIKISGYLQYYDEETKSWQPAEHKKIKLIVDEKEVGETITDANGKFTFETSFTGDHNLEIAFEGAALLESCSVTKKVSAMSKESKRRIALLVKMVFALLILLVLLLLLIIFILSNS